MFRTVTAIGLAAGIALSTHARALTFEEAGARLISIDSELSKCVRDRVLTAVIVVKFLRGCLADFRRDERDLRGDLNKWIGTLAGDDPKRGQALEIRVDLNTLRAFVNALNTRLKTSDAEIDAEIVEFWLPEICSDLALPERRQLQPEEFEPPSGYKRMQMPGMCFGE